MMLFIKKKKEQKLTREVQVSDAKLGTLDVYWQVHFATARQILDVAVAAMLRSSRNGASTLLRNLCGGGRIC